MKIFISGPTDDVPLHRLRRFNEIKRYFENDGHEIITEIDIPYPELENDIKKMVDDCQKEPEMVTWLVLSLKKVWMMTQCDALFLLPNWCDCHTSIMIFVTARKLGIPVFVDDGSTINLVNENEVKDWFQKQINP